MEIIKNGALIDTRTEDEKKKDFTKAEVVASSTPVLWVEKTKPQWRQFPIFDQDGSGSCVAQTAAKELGIMRWQKDGIYVHFSATDIYQRRNNKPAGGMGSVDNGNIIGQGVTLEMLTPSQGMSDTQMDSATVEPYKRSVGDVFKVPNYLELPSRNIEEIASTIQATGKGVMVWFYFKNGEWTDRPTVKYPDLDFVGPDTAHHSVTAVDFCLVGGKKCLIIEDSWGPGAALGGQRIIDEAWFSVRNFYARYLINFKFDQVSPVKPHHTFMTDLQFGQQGGEVSALQDCLKFEGLFPSNADSTGFFGAITKKAVQDFQNKYMIALPNNPGYGRVGPLTRQKLNIIYG